MCEEKIMREKCGGEIFNCAKKVWEKDCKEKIVGRKWHKDILEKLVRRKDYEGKSMEEKGRGR